MTQGVVKLECFLPKDVAMATNWKPLKRGLDTFMRSKAVDDFKS